MNVRVLHPAERELSETIIWYEEQRRGLGATFAEEARQILTSLSATAPAPHLSERELHRHFRNFPYTVIYRYAGDVCVVIAFAHQRRRPHYWRDRQP